MEKIVIIGLGSAGYAALMAIKKANPKCDITIIDRKNYDLMHPCGMPYAIEGIVDPHHLTQNINLSKMNVEKITGSISSISPHENKVYYTANDSEQQLEYNSLIITTGSSPVIPPIKGLNEIIYKGIYTLTNVDECSIIINKIHDSNESLVIGAGAIGLETAFALRQHMHQVTVVEMRDQILPGVLDQDYAMLCEDYLSHKAIVIKTGFTVEEIIGPGKFSGVRAGDTVISGDLGILAAGFKANCLFAQDAGIQCNNNGIIVNDTLETSIPGIYAAGDCISAWSVIDNKPVMAKLATSAYKQGTLAGINASGGHSVYKGTAGTFVTQIGELEVAGTGYTTAQAKESGYEPVSGKISSGILPEYFPDNDNISVKVIFDKNSGKVLGAQSVGKHGAAARINIISMAIEYNIPVDELSRLELAYCPAVSEVYDPLLRAIDFGLRRKK